MAQRKDDRIVSKIITLSGDNNFYIAPSGSAVVIGSGQEEDASLGRNKILSVATGDISGSFTGSFVGDGSGITGVTAEWDGSHVGDASITGSLFVTEAIEGSLDGNSSTATSLETARTIGGVSFDGTANISLPGVDQAGTQDTSGNAATATSITTTTDAGDAAHYVTFVDSAAATQQVKTDAGITYNPSDNKLIFDKSGATSEPAIRVDADNNNITLLRAESANTGNYGFNIRYLGAGTGDDNKFAITMDNQEGTDIDALLIKQNAEVSIPISLVAPSITGSLDGTATNATNITTTTDSGNATHYITFADSTAATQQLKTDTGIQYNPSTNTLTTVKLQATSEVQVYDGATTSDTIVKMYDSNDDGVIDVYQNNSVKARIHGNGDSYFTGGGVRVGATSNVSSEKLTLVNATTGENTGFLYAGGTSNGSPYFSIAHVNSSLTRLMAGSINTGDNELAFSVSDDSEFEAMRIAKTGMVGIGTDSPNAGLHIDISGEPQLLLDGGDNSHGDIVVPNGEILQIGHWNDGADTFTSRMSMQSDGAFTINSTSNDTDEGLLQIKQASNNHNGGGLTIIQSGNTHCWTLWHSSAGNLHFSFNGSTKGFLNDGVDAQQIDFTGQHRCSPSSGTSFAELSSSVGKIVVSSGLYDNLNSSTSPAINESIPTVELSSARNQKAAFGVVSDSEDETGTREYKQGNFVSVYSKDTSDKRLFINSVGEGAIWVTNINGNLENGDFITTCEISGYGMKQDSEMLCNYTVAKITMDCDFDLSAENYECVEIEHDGVTYRAAFVGCTYHCG